MLFRIWFLYACKLATAGLALAAAGFIANGSWPLATTIGLGLLIPIYFAGAILGILLALNPNLLKCPICEDHATFQLHNKQPAVNCKTCGLVFCKSVPFSFKLIREPNYEKSVL